MKIPKVISFEQEVEVDVCAEDIAAALMGATDSPRACLLGINNCAAFLKSVPDDVIAGFNVAQRQVISDFYQTVAQRFAPPGAPVKA